MDTLTIAPTTITTPATVPATVPAIPAEQLETIPTRSKRLSVSAADRKPTRIGKARASVQPRAWVMGGAVD